MATVLNASDQLTFAEMAKRLDDQGNVRKVAEVMNETNEISIDMPFTPASDGDIDLSTFAEVKEEGETVHAGEGVASSAHTTQRTTNYTALVKRYAQVSNDVLDKAVNRQMVLQKESNLTLKGMGLLQARLMVHGDFGKNSTEFNGFSTRRNALGDQCFSMGGSGSALTSIYLCALGDGYTKGIYPKTSKSAGMEIKHWSDVDIITGTRDGKELHDMGDKTMYKQQYGLSVEDPYSLIRLCNINPASVDSDALVKKIFSLMKMLSKGAPTYALYANRDILDILDWASVNRVQVTRTAEDPWGRAVQMMRECRIRQVDQITTTESAIA